FRGHVYSSGAAFLVFPKHPDRLVDNDPHVRRIDVLWRRFWHDARVRGRLFWPEKRRPDLRFNADRVELCQRSRPVVHRPHARDNWFLSRRAARHRRSDDGFNTTADPGATTASSTRATIEQRWYPERGGCTRLARKIVKCNLCVVAARWSAAV